jgi:thioredoxin reductase
MNNAQYIILGGGPAGLQMAYFLEKAGRDYLVLERGARPGAFFEKLPRHRKLISINKVYTGHDDPEKNLRWDWNSLLCDSEALRFKNFSKLYWPTADQLVHYLGEFAAHYALRVRYGANVSRIARRDGGFTLTGDQGETYDCERLIVATGVSRPYVPPIPGVELAENYIDVPLDPESFANQRVLILGKGNSAFEMAELLTETTALLHVCSPHSLKMAWATHHVGHLRAVNNNLLDSYQLKLQNAVLDANVSKIERRGDKLFATICFAHAEGEVEEVRYDRVIVCTGFRLDPKIFDASAAPELMIQDRFPKQTPAWESTNVPGMFFAGTLMQARDFKTTSSSFIHGFRYNIRALHQILEARYHGVPLPKQHVEPTPEAMSRAVLGIINRSSALWQQFGFLGDVICAPTDGPFEHFEGLPIEYIHQTLMEGVPRYYVVTLEYGAESHGGDIFSAPRIHKDAADRADQSQFLHPVVRRYEAGRLSAVHHIIEDLESTWVDDAHTKPLLGFFQRELSPGREGAAADLQGSQAPVAASL